MPVTAQDIAAAIQFIYDEKISTYVFKHVVSYAIDYDDHQARVCLALHEQFVGKPEPQSIGISFVFMDAEGQQLTLNHLPDEALAQFCVSQHDFTNWSSFEVHAGENNVKLAVLHRAIGTSENDLELARKRDFSSELYSAMFHVQAEFEKLAPSVLGLIGCTGNDAQNMQALLNLPVDGTGM